MSRALDEFSGLWVPMLYLVFPSIIDMVASPDPDMHGYKVGVLEDGEGDAFLSPSLAGGGLVVGQWSWCARSWMPGRRP